MIIILITLILLFIAGWLLMTKSDYEACAVIGFFTLLLTLIGTVIYANLAWFWFAAEHKVNIVNREYGTNYTQQEMFYAKDVIETVRQLNRQRYELNGDLFQPSEENEK